MGPIFLKDPDEVPHDVLVQIDKICLRFEAGWQAGRGTALRTVLPEVAESYRPALFRELVRLELEYQDDPRLDAYVAAYPEFAEVVRAVFPGSRDAARGGGVSNQVERNGSGREFQPELVGNYRIIHELGRGGMGVVYKATQLPLGRDVAVKVMAPMRSSETEVERFRREAEVAGRLHHTNIVPIFEAGQDGDVRFYAMQYIAGRDLHRFIQNERRKRGRGAGKADLTRGVSPRGHSVAALSRIAGGSHRELSDPVASASEPDEADLPAPGDVGPVGPSYFRRVAEMGAQVAGALAYAHAQEVIHRDIKPTNLLLDAHGTVWITDFGLVKTIDSDLTSREAVLGTLRYLPPERLGGICDARSDVYSLGLTLYELATLEPALAETDHIGLLEAIHRREPKPPRLIDPRIPRDLETIIVKATQKRPGDRYQSATDLAEDLRRFLAGEPTRARPIGTWERTWIWGRRRPLAALGVAVLCAALLSIVVLSVMFARAARRHADELSEALVAVRKSEAMTRRSNEEARREESRAIEAKGQANRVAARLAFANALSLAEKGSVERALFEMLTALESVPPEADQDSFRRVIRANLVAWQRQAPRLRYAFDLPGSLPTRRQLEQTADGGDRNLFVSKAGEKGEFVTVGYDRMVRRWSFVSGNPAGPAFPLAKTGVAMSVSDDGKKLAAYRIKNTIQNLETGEITPAPVVQHTNNGIPALTPMAFAGPSVIVTTSDNPVDHGIYRFWDERTAREFPFRLNLGAGDCYEVIEGNEGQPLLFVSRMAPATTPEPRLEAWDLRTGARLSHPFPLPKKPDAPGKRESPRTFVALPLGERVRTQLYAKREGPICTWNLDTGQLASPPWTSPVAPVYQVLIGEDRVLAVQCRDDRIRLFDLDTGRQLGGTLTIPGMISPRFPSKQSVGMALSADGGVLVALDSDCAVRGWDLTDILGQSRQAQGRLPCYLPRGTDSPAGERIVALAPDGSRAFIGRGERGRVIGTETGQYLGPPIVHPLLNQGQFSPDGNYLATATLATPRGDAPIVRIWGLRGRAAAFYEAPRFIWGLRFSPDSLRLAVAGVGGTVVLNTLDGKVLHTLKEESCAVNAAFSPDGRLLAVAHQRGWDGVGPGLRVWNIETGKPASEFRPAPDRAYNAARLEFAAGGKALLSLDPSTNEVLRLSPTATTGASTRLSANHPNVIASWPGLDLIATANAGGSLEVCTVTDGRRRWVAPSSGEVKRLQLSSDGKILAVVDSDQSVRLWDTETGWTLGPPFAHPAEISDLTFAADGGTLVTATRAGQVFRWSVPRPMSGTLHECATAIQRRLGMAARSGELVLLKPQEWRALATMPGNESGPEP